VKGRKPKPVAQKRAEGNPGKRKLHEPLVVKPGAPEKPDDLPPAGSQLWDELVPALTAAGVLEQVDRAAFIALCVQWGRAEQARAVIREQGAFALGSMGQLVAHPAVGLERDAHAMLLRFAEQYGLTAAARARIGVVGAGAAAAGEAKLAQVIDLTPRVVDE
jgi:P27 family predicted phage terminase small subunit